MNSFVIAEAYKTQQEVNRRYDRAIRIVWAPKIQRFVICEDKLETRTSTAPDGSSESPWINRDPDLEGAQHFGMWGEMQQIGIKTTLEARRRLETREGDYMPPDADIVIAILAMECPRAGDRDPTEFGMAAVERREALRRKKWAGQIKDALPTMIAKKNNRVYSTPSGKR